LNISFVKRLCAAGAALTMLGVVSATTPASATIPNAPIGQAPRFYNLGTAGGLQQIRSAGSETTYYMMATLGNLYTQSSIFGCVLNSSDNRTCTQSNNSATDELDDWNRTEYTNGAGVGSGGGIGQLCGSKGTGGLTVDFARSSRALGSSDYSGSCTTTNLQTLNYADDSIVPEVFGGIGTTPIGTTPVCTAALISAGDLINGTCQIGPVAMGWVPGNALGGPYSGTAMTDMTVFGGSPTSNTLASRIYCTTTNPSPITDWGQLTGGSTVGGGTAENIPLYIPFVNTASGTYSTYKGLVGCDTNGPNKDGQLTQENDTPQLSDEALTAGQSLVTRWPDFNTSGTTTTDPPLTGNASLVFAENQLAASIYYMSFGVNLTKKYTGQVSLPTGCTGSGCTIPSTSATKLTVDGIAASEKCDFPDPGICTGPGGTAPVNGQSDLTTARQLFNVVKVDTIRGSVAGFMNYVCDANNMAEYGTDLTNGKNYGQEVSQAVTNSFGFPYQNCASDSSGNDIDVFVAPGTTPVAGQYVVPSSTIGS
jgi:hypothetical protein